MDKMERRLMHEKVYDTLAKFAEDESKHPWNGDNRHFYLCTDKPCALIEIKSSRSEMLKFI